MQEGLRVYCSSNENEIIPNDIEVYAETELKEVIKI